MSDQIFSSCQSFWDDVRDAVAVALHIRLSGPCPIDETLFVDREPLQRVQIRSLNGSAIIVRAGSHVDSQRPTIVRPWCVVASADRAAGCDRGIR